jgi:mono/diheme cytochrome c family protein
MKKILAIAAIIAVSAGAAYISSCNNQSDTPSADKPSDSLKKVLERGEYLAVHVANCIECHSQHDMTKYSIPVVPGTEGGGGFAFDEKLGLPGVLYGKNITPDSATGIGTWTDEEILRAMTQGISKNGDTLFPLMPYTHFNRMAKDDLLSIIAYIRTLKPISNKVPPRNLMVPMAVVYPGKFLQPSIDGNVRPPASDVVKYGEYMTTMADCGNCHSPQTPAGPDMTRMFAGGYTFDIGTNKVNSANITPDSLTGIGAWTEAMFVDKFAKYRDKSLTQQPAGNQNTIMPVSLYAGMTDEDLKAIYAYLRTVKPISNKVEKFPK